MLTDYLDQAMAMAIYQLDNDGYYCGAIPPLNGVWSIGPSLEESERRLRLILEDWVVVSLQQGNSVPVLGDVDLNAPAVALLTADAFA